MAQPDFDIARARADGVTDAEIADYLAAEQPDFDIAAARAEGVSDAEIADYLASQPLPAGQTEPKAAPQREGMDLVDQYFRVGARALLPYTTAAGLGAAAGAPFAGVGAVPGAAAGVLSLGAVDLGTSIYNAFAPTFGGQRVPTGSEAIQNLGGEIGIGRKPETAGQQVFSDVLQGASGGLAQTGAFGVQAARQAPGITRNIMQQFAQQPVAQTAAAGGAAAAPSIAQNYFGVDNPAALTALSLGGGLVGGRLGTQRPTKVTAKALEEIKKKAYAESKNAGVNVSAQAMDDLERQVDDFLSQVEYRDTINPLVAEARRLFTQEAGKDISFELLDKFRQRVRDYPYSQGGGKRGTAYDRALVGRMADLINDFTMNLTPAQTTAGDAADAIKFLSIAKDAAKRGFQSEVPGRVLQNALKKETGSTAKNIRTGFDKLADNPNRMAGLDPKLKTDIESLAAGQGFRTAERMGKFAPNINLQNLGGLAAGGAGASYMGQPALAGLGATLGGGALISKAVANQIAKNRANAMIDRARGTPEFKVPIMGITSQTAQQTIPQIRFPEFDPETGAPLVGIGDDQGVPYPMYGTPPQINNARPRR